MVVKKTFLVRKTEYFNYTKCTVITTFPLSLTLDKVG